MERPQVIVAFMLLHLHLVSMKPKNCPSCPEGYFLKENCTITKTLNGGIRCSVCTNCSALDQETVIACSKTADAVCGPKSTTSLPPTVTKTLAADEAADFVPDQWIVLCVIVVSLVLIILFALFLCCAASFCTRAKHKVWV